MPALDGLKVIDLTRVLAGPFCTMLLGDMGADVIKIEEPELGDDTRGWAPFIDGVSSYFLSVNRNKRSVALDLKSPAGVEVMTRLVREADVLVENLRPGTLERAGFGYERLARSTRGSSMRRSPATATPGRVATKPGYDPVMQAEAGVMDITGPADGEPSRVGVAVTDFLAGQFMFSGILLALRERDRTGRGQAVDIALFDAILAAMTLPAGIAFATGRSPVRMGNRHPSIAPYETFRAKDGLVMVCAGNPKLWRQFCQAIERPDLPDDPRFVDNNGRLRHRDALVEVIEACEYAADSSRVRGPPHSLRRAVRPREIDRRGAGGSAGGGAGHARHDVASRPWRRQIDRQSDGAVGLAAELSPAASVVRRAHPRGAARARLRRARASPASTRAPEPDSGRMTSHEAAPASRCRARTRSSPRRCPLALKTRARLPATPGEPTAHGSASSCLPGLMRRRRWWWVPARPDP